MDSKKSYQPSQPSMSFRSGGLHLQPPPRVPSRRHGRLPDPIPVRLDDTESDLITVDQVIPTRQVSNRRLSHPSPSTRRFPSPICLRTVERPTPSIEPVENSHFESIRFFTTPGTSPGSRRFQVLSGDQIRNLNLTYQGDNYYVVSINRPVRKLEIGTGTQWIDSITNLGSRNEFRFRIEGINTQSIYVSVELIDRK